MKDQRFVATISLCIWAEDEAGAKRQAQTLVEEQRKLFDNRAAVDRIYYMPIGHFFKGADVDVSDIEQVLDTKEGEQ